MKSVFTFVSKAFFEPMHVPILPRQSRDRDHQTTWVGKCVLYLLRQAVSELEANASCGTIGYARVATWILDLTYALQSLWSPRFTLVAPFCCVVLF
jgi:hypothetical protein